MNYYSGGLAEIVSNPSPLTYSYLEKWFSGKGSLGDAMRFLSLPVSPISDSILVLRENGLAIDLDIEEKTLYSQTIFKYAPQTDSNKTPNLKIDPQKLLNPLCFLKTSQIILTQATWVASPEKIYQKLQKSLTAINEEDSSDYDSILSTRVWPVVIEIATLAEFFNQLLQKDFTNNPNLQDYIFSEVAKKDWFLASITDQAQVKNKKLSFKEYLDKYGLRADDDYELTCPRWYEIPEKIKLRIEKSQEPKNTPTTIIIPSKAQKLVDLNIKLQLLRLEAKKVALVYIDKLRQHLLKNGSLSSVVSKPQSQSPSENQSYSGKGVGVSAGEITGVIKVVTTPDDDIPIQTIGLFPNASPTFAALYPKCTGMIFLKGGLTSHGSIVAREFHIPALIDSHATSLKDGEKVSINGKTGVWTRIDA